MDGALWGDDGPIAGPHWRDAEVVRVIRTSAIGGGGRTARYELTAGPRWRVKGPEDLEVADLLLRRRQSADRRALLPDRLDALVFDFDGVFTDNKVTVLEEGREAVVCDRSDGLGLERLRKRGWPMVVISKETHPIVAARCRKLKLECIQGIDDKRPVLLDWLAARGLEAGHTLYVGNDDNDVPCLEAVGCPVAVADAYPEARRAARLILERPGGRGRSASWPTWSSTATASPRPR